MNSEGWLEGARRVESPNCDDRPADTEISLLIVHSISLPPGEYGGDAIERFFTNRLDPRAHPYFEEIAGMRVSAHFLVQRDGKVVQFVPVLKRAWHAGVSSWRGRGACNDFSVGVELEGTDDSAFDEAQYRSLEQLVGRLRRALPLRDIAAHSDVAPGRKSDPGAGFAWARFLARLSQA
jgi:AmpD protein